MIKTQIFIFIILVIIILATCVYYFIFNIYEVTYSVRPKHLVADSQSTLSICTIPINALGIQVPFRYAPANFQIVEGRNLIIVIERNNRKGKLILRAKGKSGIVLVQVNSDYSLFPSTITILLK